MLNKFSLDLVDPMPMSLSAQPKACSLPVAQAAPDYLHSFIRWQHKEVQADGLLSGANGETTGNLFPIFGYNSRLSDNL